MDADLNEQIDAGIRGMTVEQYRAHVEPPVRPLREVVGGWFRRIWSH